MNKKKERGSSKGNIKTYKKIKRKNDDENIISKQIYSYDNVYNEITEKEVEIVNQNVDNLREISRNLEVSSQVIKDIISIVEDFLRSNKLICYGGTAINNILPLEYQFYDYSKEIPDYDFFSKNALEDAKRLSDIYFENGFSEVEAKSGMHPGTYKVYVNFIPIADITQLSREIYNNLYDNAIDIYGIFYAPPDYLRMSIYLELSRPRGDISRWEKLVKRLSLLNKSYPMYVEEDCMEIDFSNTLRCKNDECDEYDKLKSITLEHLIGSGVVFFGGYAMSLYSKHMNAQKNRKLKDIPYYDVISQDAVRDTYLLKAKLKYKGFNNIKTKVHRSLSENIPEHYEISVNGEIIAFIYKALACHNYNTVRIDDNNVNIATIDTMLSLYLAFLYSNDKHLNNVRIMCMAKFMFDLHQKNRLNQRGLFRRFNLPCIGYQETIMDIRRKKSEKYEELKKNKDIKEFEKHFLRYIPNEMKNNKLENKNSIKKTSIKKNSIKNSDKKTRKKEISVKNYKNKNKSKA